MPRAERYKRASAKALAEAAAKPGQSKITSLFAKENEESEIDSGQNEDEETANIDDGSQNQVTEDLRITASWETVTQVDDFTNEDKERSVKNGRYFQAGWLKTYEWLVYNRQKNKAFCKTCSTHAEAKGVFGNDEIGFNNWKKGPEKFKEHQESSNHKTAHAKSVRVQPSITTMCSSYCLELQQLRRQGLISHLQTLKTLLRQGIAIRGRADSESNIYQFNTDKAINDKALKLILDENRYVNAHDILEEQKQLLVLSARRHLLENILKRNLFSIIADESSDVSKKEQLSFSVRTCNDNYEVSEDFVGIYECLQGLSSDALMCYTKDILVRCGMDGHKMAAMGFDGASAMKSLARKLKEDIAPNAVYVHCFAHCNELIVQDAIKQSNLLSTSLDLCQSLYAIVGAYPKRILLFEEIQAEFQNESNTDDYKILRLKSLSVTRWTTRVKAADVIFEKSAELRATLERLQKDTSITADTKARVRGILRQQLSSLNVLFNLNATRKLLVLLEKLSKELQAVDISAEYGLFSIRHVLRRLQEMRSDEEFEFILDEAKKVFALMEWERSEIVNSRQRKIPRWMEDNEMFLTEHLPVTDAATDNNAITTEMRRSYYQAIDAIVSSLTERFEQDDLSLLKYIEELLLTSMKERGVSLDDLSSSLTSFVDKELLKSQIDDLPTILGLYNAEHKKTITEVTRISTVAEIFSAMPSAKIRCSEIHKLIIYYYTVPLASATCERTFSAMRRLKTWLRSNMKGNHLNDIMFANIQKSYIDMVEVEKIAKEFAEKNEKRIKYFGKYHA